MYHSKFGGLQGRAIASYFKVVCPKCTACAWYLGGSGGILPQEKFVKLDARRSLLRQFLGPKSHMFYKILANGI